ncbi:hypothetical protein CROQUDRAFT_85709 [Cronartium quercuum f. sp. fusiforme G11]|uniref:Uncharacterized protein n=1 Tax=Cronartium quercuum f. sp. fusiforme G11 TaxID=708437 RepID=A0A9P6NY68_9BASI|nr:hypothetical protein CROQUDRAFT_85709 [Cronartium quercuum f. sp. fusiforme G11]
MPTRYQGHQSNWRNEMGINRGFKLLLDIISSTPHPRSLGSGTQLPLFVNNVEAKNRSAIVPLSDEERSTNGKNVQTNSDVGTLQFNKGTNVTNRPSQDSKNASILASFMMNDEWVNLSGNCISALKEPLIILDQLIVILDMQVWGLGLYALLLESVPHLVAVCLAQMVIGVSSATDVQEAKELYGYYQSVLFRDCDGLNLIPTDWLDLLETWLHRTWLRNLKLHHVRLLVLQAKIYSRMENIHKAWRRSDFQSRPYDFTGVHSASRSEGVLCHHIPGRNDFLSYPSLSVLAFVKELSVHTQGMALSLIVAIAYFLGFDKDLLQQGSSIFLLKFVSMLGDNCLLSYVIVQHTWILSSWQMDQKKARLSKDSYHLAISTSHTASNSYDINPSWNHRGDHQSTPQAPTVRFTKPPQLYRRREIHILNVPLPHVPEDFEIISERPFWVLGHEEILTGPTNPSAAPVLSRFSNSTSNSTIMWTKASSAFNLSRFSDSTLDSKAISTNGHESSSRSILCGSLI